MRYARADIDLKREAFAQVFPEVLAPPKGGAFVFRGNDITGWLRRFEFVMWSGLRRRLGKSRSVRTLRSSAAPAYDPRTPHDQRAFLARRRGRADGEGTTPDPRWWAKNVLD